MNCEKLDFFNSPHANFVCVLYFKLLFSSFQLVLLQHPGPQIWGPTIIGGSVNFFICCINETCKIWTLVAAQQKQIYSNLYCLLMLK